MVEDNYNNISLVAFVLGFAFRFIGDIDRLNVVLELLVKCSSLISFMIFLFLNYPKIKDRILKYFEENKQKKHESK